MVDELVISETFGPTFQGEGPSTGRRCAFIRLGRCNLDCSWCDTPFTWDWRGKNGVAYDPAKELRRSKIEALVDAVRLHHGNPRLVVISGGEPLVQHDGLVALVETLVADGHEVEIETNGTRRPGALLIDLARFNVSPKLANSGIDYERRIVPDALAELALAHAAFKFVVTCAGDLDEVDALVLGMNLDASRVWIMPEGRHRNEITVGLGRLKEPVLERGYNLSGRLHVMLWGDERGK